MCDRKTLIEEHPCFNKAAHHNFGRIHLAVAPACNIKCNYCTRKYDCANENRPGVASSLLKPAQAVKRVAAALAKDSRIRVVGIAGPGDPLANANTFETLRLVQKRFPQITKCISTNGLLLPEKADQLAKLGVSTLTVTMNTIDPKIGKDIYGWVAYQNKKYNGEAAAEILLANQLAGIKAVVKRNMVVKVNCVLIPGVNDDHRHLQAIAHAVSDVGAFMMNIMPLIPQAEFETLTAPTKQQVALARQACAPIIKQMQHCRQCRADAVGMIN
ncbi:MAG: nitrogenase cofactor biosynthesis protein NifB [Desulfotomaculum sp.]|nr:nitrogenase cofactor biosynthesis protein NifB [Desulfotomaculum sp.]